MRNLHRFAADVDPLEDEQAHRWLSRTKDTCDHPVCSKELAVRVVAVLCLTLATACSKKPEKTAADAAPPAAAFEGKCSTTGESGEALHRFHKGRDVAYEKSFCEDIAKGSWSAKF